MTDTAYLYEYFKMQDENNDKEGDGNERPAQAGAKEDMSHE